MPKEEGSVLGEWEEREAKVFDPFVWAPCMPRPLAAGAAALSCSPAYMHAHTQ